MDVAPARRGLLELLAQLADEHVDGAVPAHHRVAPEPRVDLLALEHATLGGRQQLDQLELAAAQGPAAVPPERRAAGAAKPHHPRPPPSAPPAPPGAATRRPAHP